MLNLYAQSGDTGGEAFRRRVGHEDGGGVSALLKETLGVPLQQQQLGLLLWWGFDPWPRSFCMQWVWLKIMIIKTIFKKEPLESFLASAVV